MNDIKTLQDTIEYSFKDEALLLEALTHSSFSNEVKINKPKDYERLEFLGDAVLELLSSEFIFHEKEGLPEGQMTKLRASMVCEPTLANCARDFSLQNYIRLGKGEENTGGRNRDSIVSDVCEALIGAVYLDGGLNAAKKMVHKLIFSDIDKKIAFMDSKSKLQEIAQRGGNEDLKYEVIAQEGPEHDKSFTVQVYLKGEVLGQGKGHNKKHAEQMAAMDAINRLRV